MTNIDVDWRVFIGTFFEVNSASWTVYWTLCVLSVVLVMDGLVRGYRTPPKRSASGPSLSPFSTNPNQLQEMTLGANGTMFDQTKISPMRGRSVKEYDEQITGLKKENFNLKLRIYFLEERMGSTFRLEDKDNIFRKNIEYQVDIETLRKEVEEKQDLLCQAVKALELEDGEHKRILAVKESQITELNERIEALEKELKSISKTNSELIMKQDKLMDDSTQMYSEAFGLHTENSQAKEQIQQLQEQISDLETQLSEERHHSALLETDARDVECLQLRCTNLETELHEKSQKLAALVSELEQNGRTLSSCNLRIRTLEDALTARTNDLNFKQQEISQKDETIQHQAAEVEELRRSVEDGQTLCEKEQRQTENLKMAIMVRDNTIADLENKLEKCKSVIRNLEAKLDSIAHENKRQKDELHTIKQQRRLRTGSPPKSPDSTKTTSTSLSTPRSPDSFRAAIGLTSPRLLLTSPRIEASSPPSSTRSPSSSSSSNAGSELLDHPSLRKSHKQEFLQRPARGIEAEDSASKKTSKEKEGKISNREIEAKSVSKEAKEPLQKQLEVASEEVKLKEKKISKLEADQRKAFTLIQNLISHTKAVDKEVTELKSLLREKEDQIDEMKKKCAGLPNFVKYATTNTSLPGHLNDKENSVEEEKKKNVEDLCRGDDTLLEWEKQIESLLEVIQEKEEELEAYRQKYEVTTSTLEQKDNRITELEQEVTVLKQELGTVNKKLAEFLPGEKSASWTKVAEEKDKKIEQLESEVRKHTFNLQGIVNNELWDKNREIEKLQNRFTEKLRVKEVEISSLEKEVTNKDLLLKILRDRIAELGVQINLPCTLLTPSKENVAAESLEEQDIVTVKEQLKIVKEENRYLCKTVEELQQQVRNTPERDCSLPGTSEELEARLLEQQQETFTLKSQLRLSKEECLLLRKAAEELQQQLRNKPERDTSPNLEIAQLKAELAHLQSEYEKSEKLRLETVNLCTLLTTRLEELAHFLDSLLKHKSVLGVLGSKQRSAIKQAIDQSLDLSKSLSVSMMEDQSLIQLTSLTGLLNTTFQQTGNSLLDASAADSRVESSWRNSEIPSVSLTFNSHLSRQRGDALQNDVVAEQAEIITILRAQIETLKKEIEVRDTELCRQNLEEGNTARLSSDNARDELKNDEDLVEVLMELQNKSGKKSADLILSPKKIYQKLLLADKSVAESADPQLDTSKKAYQLDRSLSVKDNSESEAWSEPDRCVSQARMGLKTSSVSNRSRSSNRSASIEATSESTEEEPTNKTPSKRGSGSVESRHTITLLQDNLSVLENKLKAKENEILSLKTAILELDNKSLELKLKMSEEIAKLRNEKIDVENLLKDTEERIKNVDENNQDAVHRLETLTLEKDAALEEAQQNLETWKEKVRLLEESVKQHEALLENKLEENNRLWKSKLEDVERDSTIRLQEIQTSAEELKKQYESVLHQRAEMTKHVAEMKVVYDELDSLKSVLQAAEQTIGSLQLSESELKKKLNESEDLNREKVVQLKRELNESTLRASQAALERTKVSNEKLKLEAEIRKLQAQDSVKSNELMEKDKEILNLKNQFQKQIAQVEQQKSCLELKVSELESINAELHNRIVKFQMSGGDFTNFKVFGKHSLGSSAPTRSGFTRQRSDMSGYASEDVLTDENDAFFNRSAPEAFHYWFNQQNLNVPDNFNVTDARNVANSSPDLGIESDQGRFSSLETNVATRPLLQTLELTASMNNLLTADQTDGQYCNVTAHKLLDRENTDLKKKMMRLEAGLEKSMAELSKINKNKKQVEKAVCKQIHKTSIVLRQARANLDSGSENENKRK